MYNLRKRGGDSADKYFRATELIAGVKDMRFQALMPDVLHWLGIRKIDNMVSMSDMYVPLPLFGQPKLTQIGICTGNTMPSSAQVSPLSNATISLVRSPWSLFSTFFFHC